MRKTFFAAFAILLNTLLGNGLLLLPGPLNGLCLTGSWVVPLVALPLQAAIVIGLYYLPQNSFFSAAFGVLCTFVAGFSVMLTVRVTCMAFLPTEYGPFLAVIFAVLLYAVVLSKDGIYRLNLLLLVCMGIIMLLFGLSAADGSIYRLKPFKLDNLPYGCGLCLISGGGILCVPALKRENCALWPLLTACGVAALVLSGVCAAVTACIGAAGDEVVAAFTVLRGSGDAVYLRLLGSALLYNLLSLKPALNCAHGACVLLSDKARPAVAIGSGIIAVVTLLL